MLRSLLRRTFCAIKKVAIKKVMKASDISAPALAAFLLLAGYLLVFRVWTTGGGTWDGIRKESILDWSITELNVEYDGCSFLRGGIDLWFFLLDFFYKKRALECIERIHSRWHSGTPIFAAYFDGLNPVRSSTARTVPPAYSVGGQPIMKFGCRALIQGTHNILYSWMAQCIYQI